MLLGLGEGGPKWESLHFGKNLFSFTIHARYPQRIPWAREPPPDQRREQLGRQCIRHLTFQLSRALCSRCTTPSRMSNPGRNSHWHGDQRSTHFLMPPSRHRHYPSITVQASRLPPPSTRIVLPVFTLFWYKGASDYLGDLVARIDASQLRGWRPDWQDNT